MLAPLNLSGDAEGCRFVDGEVTTPKGFKEAYDQFVAGGWQGLSSPAGVRRPGPAHDDGHVQAGDDGHRELVVQHVSGPEPRRDEHHHAARPDDQKKHLSARRSPSGDLGRHHVPHRAAMRHRPGPGQDARPCRSGDGSYKITGTKIFISAGDHDLAENIVHIVLARLPDAPEGTRGISLFIVPKFLPPPTARVGARNDVKCGSIEHKMGIKGSATCVHQLRRRDWLPDRAEPNKGLECMFTFMNTARIGTAIQGVGAAELSFQGALAYAKERRSMRALSGKKEPDKVADALI